MEPFDQQYGAGCKRPNPRACEWIVSRTVNGKIETALRHVGVEQEAAQIIVGAVTLGCIYGLVGVGFVILFRSTGVVSFAQGSFMLLGALFFYSLTANLGWSLIPALLCATVAMGVVGVGSYTIVFGHVFDSKPFTISVATIALGTLIGAITALIWGNTILNLPSLLSFNAIHLPLDIVVTQVDLFTIGLAVVIIGLLMIALKRTRVGLQMRAVADAPGLATYLGINVAKVSALAWGLAASTAGAAGIAYSIGTSLDPSSIPSLGLLAFPAILLGGLDSIGGALVGGVILALLQSTTTIVVGGEWSDVVGYGLLLVVLVVRPSGMFGSKEVIRV
jgi:branched-chain amino acid transport system permease protein